MIDPDCWLWYCVLKVVLGIVIERKRERMFSSLFITDKATASKSSWVNDSEA